MFTQYPVTQKCLSSSGRKNLPKSQALGGFWSEPVSRIQEIFSEKSHAAIPSHAEVTLRDGEMVFVHVDFSYMGTL